jgi:hypothetical protein
MCNQEIRLITLFFISLLPKNEVMRRIFFYTTLLFVLMAQYPQVSFAEKRNLIFTANNVDPTQNPRDKSQRTIMMMPSVAIDEYELFFSDSHPSYIIRLENEDGDVVFEQSIPEYVLQQEIPSDLKGDYKLILFQGKRMFISNITL